MSDRDRHSEPLNQSQEKYDELENKLLSLRLRDEITRYGAKRVVSVLTETLSEFSYTLMAVLTKDNQ